MIIDKSVYTRRKPKEVHFDTRITLRVNSEELNNFKDYYGNNWINKIKEFIKTSPEQDKFIYAREQEKRNRYLNKNHSMF